MPTSRHRHFHRHRVYCIIYVYRVGKRDAACVLRVRFGFAGARRHLYNGRVLAPPYRRHKRTHTHTHTRTYTLTRTYTHARTRVGSGGPPTPWWIDLYIEKPKNGQGNIAHSTSLYYDFIVFPINVFIIWILFQCIPTDFFFFLQTMFKLAPEAIGEFIKKYRLLVVSYILSRLSSWASLWIYHLGVGVKYDIMLNVSSRTRFRFLFRRAIRTYVFVRFCYVYALVCNNVYVPIYYVE